jgi:hypothetical protein
MQLTYDEITYLLKTWNSWYLIEHDSYLKSEFSENGVRIKISPFDPGKIPENVLEDLREYTDHLEIDEPEEFAIDFFFPAWEHQPDEIINALKPVLEMASGAQIEIRNFMDFLEENVPDLAEANSSYRPPQIGELTDGKEKKEKEDNPAGAELDEEAAEEEIAGLHNELVIKGVLCRESAG